MPPIRMLIFAAVMTAIVTSVHYYFWRRLVRDTKLAKPWRRVASLTLILLAAGLPTSMIVGRSISPESFSWFMYIPFIWMGVMALLFFLLLAADLLKGTNRILAKLKVAPELNSGRRTFLNRVAAGVAVSTAGGLAGAAVYQGKLKPTLNRISVTLSRLPRAFDRFRIVHLTDLHIGHTLDKAWLEDVVNETNRLAPDLVAITGDVVDGSVDMLGADLEPLSRLKAPHGVFFVTGNHEYYAGVSQWLPLFESFGVKVLKNEHVTIEKDGHLFALMGVNDFSAHQVSPDHRQDVAKAHQGISKDTETVLLAHQPRTVFEAEKFNVGLLLCGHTHGGQIWPITHLVRLQQPYNKGLFRHNENTQIYVSQGTGYWGPPMRLGTHNELTEITLLSKNPA